MAWLQLVHAIDAALSLCLHGQETDTHGDSGNKARIALGSPAAAGELGITSFGGPIAHVGYFHHEYVVRRKWVDESGYADLVALCQMIPGPTSSQLGIAIGIQRAVFWGGLAAWAGFTLPSAVVMVIFALLLHGSVESTAGWLHGLMVVAVAVVAQAVWTMARTLASDAPRASIALLAAIISILPCSINNNITRSN